MDNEVLTSDTLDLANPLEPPSPTVDAVVEIPVEPVQQDQVDVNLQANDDVALPEEIKANGYEHTNGFKLGDNHHRMEIDDGYETSEKVKPCCSMLNKLFLTLAIVCFALFLCSIAFIVANIDGVSQMKT